MNNNGQDLDRTLGLVTLNTVISYTAEVYGKLQERNTKLHIKVHQNDSRLLNRHWSSQKSLEWYVQPFTDNYKPGLSCSTKLLVINWRKGKTFNDINKLKRPMTINVTLKGSWRNNWTEENDEHIHESTEKNK